MIVGVDDYEARLKSARIVESKTLKFRAYQSP
jgi:hypothetical protein